MKKILNIGVLLLLALSVKSQGINFETNLSWNMIKEKAKKENKLIFVDVYATWCVPCKAMDKDIYTLAVVGNITNGKYISIKVQIDKTKEDNQHLKEWYSISDSIKNKYEVTSVPSFLILTAEGKALNKEVGFLDANNLIQFLQNSLKNDQQYYTQIENLNLGIYPYKLMPQLAIKAKKIGQANDSKIISEKYINNYLLKLKENDFYTKENFEFITDFFGNTNSEIFKFFVKNQDKINQKIGIENKAQYSIRYAISKDYLNNDSARNEIWWNKIEKVLTAKFGQLGQEVVYGKRMVYYLEKKDSINFGKYYCKYFKTALERPEYNINEVTWNLFQTVNDIEVLKFACDVVMKESIEAWYPNNAEAYDTYANLLYKIGRTKPAIDWEIKAVKLKAGAPDEKLYTDALDKMKKGEPTWQATELN